MKVLKFGGTSVGSAQCMKDVAKLICDGNRKIVVLKYLIICIRKIQMALGKRSETSKGNTIKS